MDSQKQLWAALSMTNKVNELYDIGVEAFQAMALFVCGTIASTYFSFSDFTGWVLQNTMVHNLKSFLHQLF